MKSKENLVQKIGMKFNEAVEFFSDETLESMAMNNILGSGTNNADVCQNSCPKDPPNQTYCGPPGSSSSSGYGYPTSY